MTKEIKKMNRFVESLCWTEEEKKEFNRTHNSPFGEEYTSGEDNQIVSGNIFLSWNDKVTHRNPHIAVLGGPASGKTTCAMLPNLKRAAGSYIVVDPYGEMLKSCRAKLRQNGTAIRVLDFSNPQTSDGYNPFFYLKNEENVQELTCCLMENTNLPERIGDPFFEKSEIALLNAVFFYLWHHAEKGKCNLREAYRMATIAPERDGEFDALFETLKETDANDPAIANYDIFRLLPEKTMIAVCATVTTRLAAFHAEPDMDLSERDTVALDAIGDTKTAVFLTGFHKPAAQKVLVPMFCMQAFRALIHHAAYECDERRLPQHVTILLDELPNLGYIPRLDHSLATCRKYRISTIMAAQTVGEMKQMYGEQTETILASCEAVVYMGGSCLASDENALKYASKWLGKTTIAGVQTSVSEETPEKEEDASASITQPLMQETIRRLPVGMCLVLIKDMPATLDEKFCGYLK